MNNLELHEKLVVVEQKLHVFYAAMRQITDEDTTPFIESTMMGCGHLFKESIDLLESVKTNLLKT